MFSCAQQALAAAIQELWFQVLWTEETPSGSDIVGVMNYKRGSSSTNTCQAYQLLQLFKLLCQQLSGAHLFKECPVQAYNDDAQSRETQI